MNRRTFLLYILFTTAAGADVAAEPTDARPVTDVSQLAGVLQGVTRAGSLFLYEGLPHPTSERELFQRERLSQEVVQIRGEWFYRTPRKVEPDDEKVLRRLCASEESFMKYDGSKRCGGFHADYCLQWEDRDAKWQVLVCFGCREVKFYGPEIALLADIGPEAFKRFQAFLGKYRGNRPRLEND